MTNQDRDEQQVRKNASIPLWIFGAMAFGIGMGFFIRNFTADKGGKEPTARVGEIEEVLHFVRERYVDTVDIEELESNAIANTLEQLDPHSSYIPAALMVRENEEMMGEYEGIGIEFYLVSDTISVVSAIGGGPSESVGIRSGDKIITVNDTTVAGIGITDKEVVATLKGPKGTKVNVGVLRNGVDNLIDFTIKRGPVKMASIDAAYMLDQKTGLIKIDRFSQKTFQEFRIELDKLVNSGMENLIVDLRGNGGGVMRDAVEILDELIDGNKTLLMVEGRKYRKEEYPASREGIFETGKLAVLIDEGSASASEIVAGAIQDWDRGVIIGRRSFGKGLVQQPYDLRDGSSLRLTIARYYTPSGRSIQRSYENGTDDYYQDYYTRYDELLTSDSIKVDSSLIKYTKIARRPVFGGGGIIPDFFIGVDTSRNNKFITQVYMNSIIPQFAYDYYSDNVNVLDEYQSLEEFEDRFFISSSVYADFVELAKKKIKDVEFSAADIEAAKEDITINVRALIAKQKFGDKGLYTILDDRDKAVLKAIEVFRQDSYSQILAAR